MAKRGRTPTIPCTHGYEKKSECKQCRSAYDLIYKERYYTYYKSYLKDNACDCCGFNHPDCLDVHHYATEFKRYGRSQGPQANIEDIENGKAMILCSNCHNIFHGFYGGRVNPFPLLTKEETIAIILASKKDTRWQYNIE